MVKNGMIIALLFAGKFFRTFIKKEHQKRKLAHPEE